MDEDKLIEQIKINIEKNGFPEKQVALPYNKIIENVNKLNLNLELFLSRLELFDIYTKQDGERLIFSSSPQAVETTTSSDKSQNIFNQLNLDELKNMNKGELMKKVATLMKDITPEQMTQMKDMYENMTPEQKQQVQDKGKELGLG